MIAQEETLVKQRCYECGDTFTPDHLDTDSPPHCPGGCPNPYLSCTACGSIFKPTAPPDGQKVYELHGCKAGEVRARIDNPTCLHCGAAKAGVGTTCGCPGDTAKRKADADFLAAKREVDRQQRQEQHRERDERVKAARPMVDLSGLRKVGQRDRKDAELLDRERAVKEREIARRERRQDGYDADASELEPETGLTFADFGQEITLLDAERMPSAFARSDGETLLYEGLANTIYGEPSSGKSWIALMAVIQQLRAGRRCIWWDNEDQAVTLAKRLQLLRATDLIGIETLAWRTGGMHESETAMAEALAFLDGGTGPGLVVIDSATSFDCPKDGADVHPWVTSHVKPWINAGHTSLLIDHVPKQRKDRPAGAVGSFEKLSSIRGAALYVHGIAWNGQQGGAVHLTIHKDAHGQLPAPKFSVVSTVAAEWDGPTFAWTVGLPNAKTESEDLQDELMEAFDQLGAEGARGSQGVRELLKGKRGRDVDKARDELRQLGLIKREKVGRPWVYTSVTGNE